MVHDLVTLIMAISKCRECGKAVSTLAKTCPHCGVPKPVKKTTKKIKKTTKVKTRISAPKKMMDVMCTNSNCSAWLHPSNVPYEKNLTIYKCPRCQETMKKYSAKIAEVLKRRKMYQEIHEENHAEVSSLRKNMQSKTYAPSSTSSTPSSSSTNYKNSSNEKSAYDKFADGNLDLATAFWLFGMLGSFAGSLILTLLAESVSKIFYFPFVGLNVFIIAALWECAENYKKEKEKKKQSPVWGYLTQVFCVVGGLGLISTVYDIIKTL